MSKSQLGQFYTTNYDYILQNIHIPNTVKHIVEPFAGNGDLLNFINNKADYSIELYDIDPKYEGTIQRDTLKDPPNYDNKFVLTNPPYLARNKNGNKEIYDMYNCNDLYKCFMISLIESECIGGIIIIPLNFISSIRATDVQLRTRFFNEFDVNIINIFEEQVFDDTGYSVCSMFFTKKTNGEEEHATQIYIYPSEKEMVLSFTEENNYTIGGEIYNLPQSKKIKVERATKQTKNINNITNIMLKCIDDTKPLGFYMVNDDERFIDNTKNLTARSYATLVINKKFTITQQKKLVNKLNDFINEKRKKYNSLFLTNYREGKRKRISFDLAFKICNYVLSS